MDDGNITVGQLVDFAARSAGIKPGQVKDVVLIIHSHESADKGCTRLAITGSIESAIATAAYGVQLLNEELVVRDGVAALEEELGL